MYIQSIVWRRRGNDLYLLLVSAHTHKQYITLGISNKRHFGQVSVKKLRPRLTRAVGYIFPIFFIILKYPKEQDLNFLQIVHWLGQ